MNSLIVMGNLASGCQMMKYKQTNRLMSASVTAKKPQKKTMLHFLVTRLLTSGDSRIPPDNLNMSGIYLCQSYTWNMQDLGEARGATLNSDQQPNHWKTPTGFQCGLPGQHEQELSTMTAKLQRTMRRAQSDRVRGRKRKDRLQFTGTKLEKQWRHAE